MRDATDSTMTQINRKRDTGFTACAGTCRKTRAFEERSICEGGYHRL
jgi:hypothetical protein